MCIYTVYICRIKCFWKRSLCKSGCWEKWMFIWVKKPKQTNVTCRRFKQKLLIWIQIKIPCCTNHNTLQWGSCYKGKKTLLIIFSISKVFQKKLKKTVRCFHCWSFHSFGIFYFYHFGLTQSEIQQKPARHSIKGIEKKKTWSFWALLYFYFYTKRLTIRKLATNVFKWLGQVSKTWDIDSESKRIIWKTHRRL